MMPTNKRQDVRLVRARSAGRSGARSCSSSTKETSGRLARANFRPSDGASAGASAASLGRAARADEPGSGGVSSAQGPPPRFAFPVLLSIGTLDSATRMGFLLFLPFVLTAKGASLPTIGLALTLVFAGGAAGKLVCAFIGARIGAVATVWLTEGLTAVLIVTLLPLPLEAAMVLLPVIGVALNGTSSVLYGSVPDLVAPERRARAFSVFYTGTIGAGAVAPAIYGVIGDALGVPSALMIVAGILLLTLPLSLVLKPALAPRPL
jgi:MFS transporter, FSR family, fosmidomycin resistance protein